MQPGGGACVKGGACVARYPSNGQWREMEPPGPVATETEMDILDASNAYSVEGNNQILDANAGIDDSPEPGPLEEKNGEVSWPRPQNGLPKSGPHPDTGSVCQEHSTPLVVS